MYNPQVISSRLAIAQEKLNFQLIEVGIEECQRRVDFINNLIDFQKYENTLLNKGKTVLEFKSEAAKKTYFSPEVQNFINSEKVLCKYWCWYWMDRYYKIKDITNTFIQYAANDAQKIWMRIHSKLEALRRAIRTLDLKARQVGKTTFAQGVVEHRLQFYDDINSMIASKDETSTGKMAGMFTDSMNKQPFWLRPSLRQFQTGDQYIYDNGSGLYLGWGTQETLAKGTTCTVSHLSEIAMFKYFVSAIQNGLIRAMHETTRLLQIFEGTAEKRDDDFHNYVKETIKGMEKGTSSLYFSFIPYFVRNDIYPPPAYINGRPEAYANFIPSTETLIHAKKAENWVLANEDMRAVLGENWKMSRETMFWYETEKNAAIERDKNGTVTNTKGMGELATFLSQCPADWEEAFQHAGKTIYPIILINSYSDKAQGVIPEVYKLRGDSNEIDPAFFPEQDELHFDKDGHNKVVQVRAAYKSDTISHFELVRIKFDGWDKFDPINKILIFHHPSSRYEYGIAVDTSDGLGFKISNNAVINVTRKGSVEYRDRQECEFVSPDLPQKIMWPFVLAISTYYSILNQQLLTIECNKGYELQNALIARGWWNLFKRIDESRSSQNFSKVDQYGILTTRGNRGVEGGLLDNFSAFFKGKWIELHSMPLIGEIKDLQKIKTIAGNTKIIGGGSGDDRFITQAINLYALHRMEILGHEKRTWETRKQEDAKIEVQEFKGYEFEQTTNLQPNGFDVMMLDSEGHFSNLEANFDPFNKAYSPDEW